MCGILGYYNLDHEPVRRSREDVEALRDMMRNRGPDASGYLEGGRNDWILAHRRLSIIDLSERGRQPMSTPDGTLHISYNGEIYNYRELRASLEKRGVVFRSSSDTEVILHLYREHGTGCFRMLEGMFAIILIDEAGRRAVMARDPVGKKPLYYALLGRNLIMASDPGVISRDRDYRKEVSVDGLYSVLAMGGVRAPNSLFRDVYKLAPGSYVVADDAFSAPASPTRFFEFALTPRSGLLDDETAIDTLDQLLDRAVAKRMISDVPFGVFLSGGIDSALIVHYMSRHTDRVNTISLDMKDSPGSLRESAAASAVAERYGTNHHTIDLDTKEYIRLLDEVVLPNSTPGMTESVLLAKLSELARATGVIVIETGEGADELFMGYDGYLTYLENGRRRVRQLERAAAVIPLCARIARLFGPDTRKNRIAHWTELFDSAANATIIRDFLYEPFLHYQAERIVAKKYRARPRRNKYRELNDSITSRVDGRAADYSPAALSVLWNVTFRWAELLLTRIDNFTMSSGVEGRAPMLDIDVMNFALSLSDRMKERPGAPKYILRQLVSRHVSPEHAARGKTGFGGGGSNILNPEVRAYLASKLEASPSYRRDPLLAKETLADEFQLFTLASLHVWLDHWM